MRLKAILYCIKFGILPWWLYEKEKHYDCSYWQHLIINYNYAMVWIRNQQTFSDIRFELSTNK